MDRKRQISARVARVAWVALLSAGMLAASAQAEIAGFDLQGHRGARGLFPENSLAAFQAALDMGVTTLEFTTTGGSIRSGPGGPTAPGSSPRGSRRPS